MHPEVFALDCYYWNPEGPVTWHNRLEKACWRGSGTAAARCWLDSSPMLWIKVLAQQAATGRLDGDLLAAPLTRDIEPAEVAKTAVLFPIQW